MSYAIRDLHIESPPATIRRVVVSEVVGWCGHCSCGRGNTPPRLKIGMVLEDLTTHAVKAHRIVYYGEVA